MHFYIFFRNCSHNSLFNQHLLLHGRSSISASWTLLMKVMLLLLVLVFTVRGSSGFWTAAPCFDTFLLQRKELPCLPRHAKSLTQCGHLCLQQWCCSCARSCSWGRWRSKAGTCRVPSTSCELRVRAAKLCMQGGEQRQPEIKLLPSV